MTFTRFLSGRQLSGRHLSGRISQAGILPRRGVFPAAMVGWRHRRFSRDVQRLFDDALPQSRVPAVLAHLRGCEDCRDDLRWWSALRDSLTDSLGQPLTS